MPSDSLEISLFHSEKWLAFVAAWFELKAVQVLVLTLPILNLNQMHFSDRIHFSKFWAYDPAHNLLFLQTSQKTLTVMELGGDLEFRVVHSLEFQYQISEIIISPDYSSVLIGFGAASELRIYNFRCQHSLTIRTEEKFTRCLWCPNSSQILVISEKKVTRFNLKGEIQATYDAPKRACITQQFIAFDRNGAFLAICSIKTAQTKPYYKEYLSIYSTKTWDCIKQVPLQYLWSAEGISWADKYRVLVWDSSNNYKILRVSTKQSEKTLEFAPEDEFLGFTQVAQSSSWIALGSEGKLRIVDNKTFNQLRLYEVPNSIKPRQLKEKPCFREMDTEYNGRKVVAFQRIQSQPLRIPVTNPQVAKEKHGKSQKPNDIKISSSGSRTYIAYKFERSPNTLFIWDFERNTLVSAILMKEQIYSFQWALSKTILCFCSKGRSINFWSPNGILPVDSSYMNIGNVPSSGDGSTQKEANTWGVYRPKWINDNQLIVTETVGKDQKLQLLTLSNETLELLSSGDGQQHFE